MEIKILGIKNLKIYDGDGKEIGELGYLKDIEFEPYEEEQHKELKFTNQSEITISNAKVDRVVLLHMMTGAPLNIIHKALYSKKSRIRKKYAKQLW